MCTSSFDYSVVVPAYNEEETIKEALTRLYDVTRKLEETFEFILVCDGDVGRTANAAKELLLPDLKIIEYEKNMGKGFALRTGAKLATGRNLVFMDADLDLEASRLPQLIEIFESKNFDLLVGSKLHPDSKVNYPKSRRFMSSIYRTVIKQLFGLTVSDTQTGLKICRKNKFETVQDLLFTNGFAFDLELICRFDKLQYSVGEGPVTLNYQFKSTLNIKSVLRMIYATITIYRRVKK